MDIKKPIILFLIITAAAVIYAAFCGILSYYVVPKVLIPKLCDYVNSSGSAALEIKSGYFSPARGVMLKGISLRDTGAGANSAILQAQSADFHISLPSFLWRRLEIKRVDCYGVSLDISRNRDGIWNFNPLLGLSPSGQAKAGFSVIVDEIRVNDGTVNYSDNFDKNNSLQKQLLNVDLTFTNRSNNIYDVLLHTDTIKTDNESLELRLNYNASQSALTGEINLSSPFIGKYFDYYIDELMAPWHLKAGHAALSMNFACKDKVWSLAGECRLQKAIIHYGDFSIAADTMIQSRLRYAQNNQARNRADVSLRLENLFLLNGEKVFLKDGNCKAVITEKYVDIERLAGTIEDMPADLCGKFYFNAPQKLILKGMILGVDNIIALKLTADNQAVAAWSAVLDDSYVRIEAKSGDLRNLMFDIKVAGDINLGDLSGISVLKRAAMTGNMKIAGAVKGETDKPSLMQGSLFLTVKDLSGFDIKPLTFQFNMSLKDGFLLGTLPELDFYKGNADGLVKLNSEKWGADIHFKKVDLSEFFEKNQDLKDMKGLLSANISCVGDWHDFKTIRGGGYFRVKGADFGKMPLFSNVEAGIKSQISNFALPVFDLVEGNFSIQDKKVKFEDTSCKGKGMGLFVNGAISFSKEADFNVGTRIFSQSFFKTARQILIPVTIGVDVMLNCIRIHITGKWPDLEKSVNVEPIKWINDFFGIAGKPQANKYNLDQVWCQ